MKIYVIGFIAFVYVFWYHRLYVPAHLEYMRKNVYRHMKNNIERDEARLAFIFAFGIVMIAWIYLAGLAIYYFFFT
jgi:hypothetical protein